MSLDLANVVLGVTPIPGLQAAFAVFRFIVSSVEMVSASRKQLTGLASTVGQLLAAVQEKFESHKLVETSCVRPLNDLLGLLKDIRQFVQIEQDRDFVTALLRADSRVAAIELFYRRIEITTSAFQISASLSIQQMLRDNEKARQDDVAALNERFVLLQKNQHELRRELDINQKNILAMIVSIERRIEEFYSHTLQYLSSISSQHITLQDWMISSFEVDYGPQIGAGGFGTVFKGTWNRTAVAIKVLRKEIEVWMTFRHPNILQFLGANILDDKPFVVMPLMPYNAREFLRIRSSFDPLHILRDIALGLEYLHARKICHGDLKGINVLVEDSGHALLCDFGLVRIKADMTSRTRSANNTTIPGSRNWMAPELLSGSLSRPPSDIYAFGMTLYELYTDEIPLAAIPYGDFIELVYRLGVRPERPEDDECPRMNDDLWQLAERSWSKDVKARPTARQIHDTIMILLMANTNESVVEEPAAPSSRSPPLDGYPRKPAIENPTAPLRPSALASSLPPPPLDPSFEPGTALEQDVYGLQIKTKKTGNDDRDLFLTVKLITDETFSRHEGFDLARLGFGLEVDEIRGPPSELPSFRVPKQETCDTFKCRVAQHFGCSENQIRFWPLERWKNSTFRVENTPVPKDEPKLTVDDIQKRMNFFSRNVLVLYLDIISSEPSLWPSPQATMFFLKYFNIKRQTLLGVGAVHMRPGYKFKDLVRAIESRMDQHGIRVYPWTKLYLEYQPGKTKYYKQNSFFSKTDVRNGSIICCEHDFDAAFAAKGSHRNAIKYYQKELLNRILLTFRPKFKEPDADDPEFSLVLNWKDDYFKMSSKVANFLEYSRLKLQFTTVPSRDHSFSTEPKLLQQRLGNIKQMLSGADRVVLYEKLV
ncbi:kinase-like domain-containing protein [Mycena olivaceomarginata]|nr:kinase-like domain-containing protein [Mycena olivaceomarginata]